MQPNPAPGQALFARTFAALQLPEYRWVWASTFLQWGGRLMTGLALGWFMLELTDSAFWVGLLAGVSGAGMFLFSVFGGWLVDRFDRRTTLIVSDLASGGLLLVLGGLIFAGWAGPWHLLGVAFLQGLLDAIQTPAVGVVTYQVVGRERLLNATAAQTMASNVARIGGSALAGYLIKAAGAGLALGAAGAAVVFAALPLLLLRGRFRPTSEPESLGRSVMTGLRYAWHSLPLRRLLTLSLIVETFGFSYSFMIPVIARDVLGVGPTGLGWLSSANGLGATVSTLLLAGLGDAKHKGALLVMASAGAGLALIGLSLSRWFPLSLVFAGAIGMGLLSYDILMQTLIQLFTTDELRGRVSSLYSLTLSFSSLGGFLAGAATALVGAPLAIGASGAVIAAFTARMVNYLRHLRPEGEPFAAVQPRLDVGPV